MQTLRLTSRLEPASNTHGPGGALLGSFFASSNFQRSRYPFGCAVGTASGSSAWKCVRRVVCLMGQRAVFRPWAKRSVTTGIVGLLFHVTFASVRLSSYTSVPRLSSLQLRTRQYLPNSSLVHTCIAIPIYAYSRVQRDACTRAYVLRQRFVPSSEPLPKISGLSA